MKYKKHDSLFREVNKSGFKCPICGEEFKRFPTVHIQKHGYSKEEFLNQFGEPDNAIRTREQNAVALKAMQLYQLSRAENKLILTKSGQYVSKDEKAKKWEFISHFKQKICIGVYPGKYGSKFLVFDIDGYSTLGETEFVARALVNYLRTTLETDLVYIFFSGGKGYHVTLFFDSPILFTRLKPIAQLIHAEFNELCRLFKVNIETRPDFKENKQGVKLPLSVNFHARNQDFCEMLDHNFKVIVDNMEAFMQIKQLKTRDMIRQLKKIEPRSTAISMERTSYSSKLNVQDIRRPVETADAIVIPDLESPGTRHNVSIQHAFKLRAIGLEQVNVHDELHKWSMRQLTLRTCLSSKAEIEDDLHRIIDYAFSKSAKILTGKVEFTKGDLENLFLLAERLNESNCSSGKSSPKINMYPTLLVAFSFMFHAKGLEKTSSEFYLTYNRITALTMIKNRKSIAKYITTLGDFDFIQIIRRNKAKSFSIMKKPNSYKLRISGDEYDASETVLTFADEKYASLNDHFRELINYALKEDPTRKRFFSQYILKRKLCA